MQLLNPINVTMRLFIVNAFFTLPALYLLEMVIPYEVPLISAIVLSILGTLFFSFYLSKLINKQCKKAPLKYYKTIILIADALAVFLPNIVAFMLMSGASYYDTLPFILFLILPMALQSFVDIQEAKLSLYNFYNKRKGRKFVKN